MLKIGKLTNDVLSDIVLKNIPHVREEVLLRPAIGEDCAAIDLKNKLCIISCDPITAANANAGTLAVYVACNDIAAAGGKPLALMVTLLIPPQMELEDIQDVIKSMSEAARSIGVEIVGGHTEVTDAVNKIVIASTAIGIPVKDTLVSSAGAKAGDAIIITKYAGLEGTAILAADYAHKLEGVISKEEMEQANALLGNISVVEEGRIGALHNAHAMHDITEGGVFGAVHEVAQASNLGVEVYEDQIPLLPVTKKITGALGINPFRLISSGSMLIATSEPQEMLKAFEENNIKATVIGRFVEDRNKKHIIKADKSIAALEPPSRDELYEIKA